MAEHIQNVIKSSSQTLHALRILRSNGRSSTITEHVFQAVVIAKLTYASQSWSGFTSAADILNAFLCRSIRQGFCPPDFTDITDIFDAADEALFSKILHHPNHRLALVLVVLKSYLHTLYGLYNLHIYSHIHITTGYNQSVIFIDLFWQKSANFNSNTIALNFR